MTPVVLALPSYAKSVHASRELVTQERAFRPVLVYLTDWGLAPFGVLWLLGAALVVRSQRDRFRGVYERVRARLATEPLPATPQKDEETKAAPPEEP